MTTIRVASEADHAAIKALHLAAFPEQERELVAKLAVDLLTSRESGIVSLLAESKGELLGYVCFSPVHVEQREELSGHILAPLAVSPDMQKQGVGSALVKAGLQKFSEQGEAFVLVYGDPAYYGRFGFNAEFAKDFLPPYALQYDFGWLGMRLHNFGEIASPLQIRCVEALNHPELW